MPDTIRFADLVVAPAPTASALLRTYLEPTFVTLTGWVTQMIATAILTVLVTAAVLRSRMHLLGEAKARVVSSDLARYVSPDAADALSDGAAADFGEPVVMDVAVLFADIVGFTGRAQRLAPDRTFALLGSFQERSSRVVLEHGGRSTSISGTA